MCETALPPQPLSFSTPDPLVTGVSDGGPQPGTRPRIPLVGAGTSLQGNMVSVQVVAFPEKVLSPSAISFWLGRGSAHTGRAHSGPSAGPRGALHTLQAEIGD